MNKPHVWLQFLLAAIAVIYNVQAFLAKWTILVDAKSSIKECFMTGFQLNEMIYQLTPDTHVILICLHGHTLCCLIAFQRAKSFQLRIMMEKNFKLQL